MSFSEKPPILSGNNRQDIANLRDYLFRMARSLDPVANTGSQNLAVRYQNGKQIVVPAGGGAESADIEQIRRNATELRDQILKTGKELDTEKEARANGDATVTSYVDSKTEIYNSTYLAKSEFGTFEETIDTRIATTARGVVESYDFNEKISNIGCDVKDLQEYTTSIDGQIRRGIVRDPTTDQWVTGIAISQDLQFTGLVCDKDDVNNPGDGHVYYYMSEGQTFGLYTSTGWQFWIGGHRKGWYNSQQETLYVENLQVADRLRIGGTWQMKSVGAELEITYVGS